MAHPWHDIVLPTDDRLDTFPVVVEIPQGHKNKYELDLETGLLRVDRVLFSSMVYPANYGFVPRTLGLDGDPLDALVLGQEPVVPLAYLQARAIGGVPMRDEEGVDAKIICVHIHDPAYDDYRDLSDLPKHLVRELRRFFADYKVLEGKPVEVGEEFGRAEAVRLVREAAERYRGRPRRERKEHVE